MFLKSVNVFLNEILLGYNKRAICSLQLRTTNCHIDILEAQKLQACSPAKINIMLLRTQTIILLLLNVK